MELATVATKTDSRMLLTATWELDSWTRSGVSHRPSLWYRVSAGAQTRNQRTVSTTELDAGSCGVMDSLAMGWPATVCDDGVVMVVEGD